ncbi:MAG: hypothetical protein JWN46_2775 [Acidimicrobiales bacterium]|nr:hypothetical protein [Acidimicrobiales bacterium]
MRRILPTVVVAVLVLCVPVACSKSKGSKEAFCSQLKRTPALSDVLSGFGSDDPRTLSGKLDSVTKAFADLERAAPREVRSDASELADLVNAISQVVKANASDPAAIKSKLRTLATSHTGAAKAALDIAGYAKQQCNIDLNPSNAPTSSAPTTAAASSTTTTR